MTHFDEGEMQRRADRAERQNKAYKQNMADFAPVPEEIRQGIWDLQSTNHYLGVLMVEMLEDPDLDKSQAMVALFRAQNCLETARRQLDMAVQWIEPHTDAEEWKKKGREDLEKLCAGSPEEGQEAQDRKGESRA